MRTYDPNLDVGWLQARGYGSTVKQVGRSGLWKAADDAGANPVRWLDGRNVIMKGWEEAEQCAFLGSPLDYFA